MVYTYVPWYYTLLITYPCYILYIIYIYPGPPTGGVLGNFALGPTLLMGPKKIDIRTLSRHYIYFALGPSSSLGRPACTSCTMCSCCISRSMRTTCAMYMCTNYVYKWLYEFMYLYTTQIDIDQRGTWPNMTINLI